jgi:hypothetical protein
MINIFGIFWCEKICLFLENQLKINFGDFFYFRREKFFPFLGNQLKINFWRFFKFSAGKNCLFLENQCYDPVFAQTIFAQLLAKNS